MKSELGPERTRKNLARHWTAAAALRGRRSRAGAARAAAALAALLALAACGQATKASTAAQNVITVAETPARLGTISAVSSFSGSVSPRWTVSIVPKIQGQIAELRVHEGQRVGQGTVIAVLDHHAQDDQLAQAKANVDAAQAKLQAMLAGARPEDVAAARAQAAAAEAAVSNLRHGRPDAVAQAKAALKAAQDKLAQAQAGGRTETVQQARDKLNADQASLNKLLAGPSPQDITNAKLAVQQAKDRLYADQTADDAQVARGLMTQQQRQASLDVDQTGIDQANTSLAKLVAPPNPNDVAQAQAAVHADQQALALAKQPNTPADIAQLQAAVQQAQAQLAQAQQPGSQAQISQAQQQANAQQALAAKAAKPYISSDIAQAQAAVQVAQAAEQTAQSSLADMTISAPASGVLSSLPIAVGSLVGPGSPIATLISSKVEVDAGVAESQIALFKQGQPATVRVSSAPQPVAGEVFFVSPVADVKTRQFTVKVEPSSPTPVLRSGMSATIEIQTGKRQNAVLAPKDAVIQRSGQEIMFLDQSGRAKMVVVRIGLSNGSEVQILKGVQPGEQIILPGSLNLADGDTVAAASPEPGPASASSSASPLASPSGGK